MVIEQKSWPHFSFKELSCTCCGVHWMNEEFMNLVEALRLVYDAPLVVTSAYRCPKHNNKVSSTGEDGPHTTGRAIDVAVSRGNAMNILNSALFLGFTGIGVNQKGSGRFMHLDNLEANRPTIWSY
tara:strand:+ start:758 stop:1135 length:378 start_codon:yes stop_codon:yes gene_type:complete